MPCFNEEGTISEVIERVKRVDLGLEKEIVVVDDGSTDSSFEKASSHSGVVVVRHERNMGKGAAVKTGIAHSTGDIVVIQDADLEYLPEDIPGLLAPLLRGEADVVYGSRFIGSIEEMSLSHRLGNRVLSWTTRLFFGSKITDMMTGYKAFKREAVEGLELRARRFEFEPEVTAKLLKRGAKIVEVPIKYSVRKSGEAKIRWRDGLTCLWWLLKEKLRRGN
ncbi:MAG: glycosyltransferase family 2 protein [Candidatus Freyarchaeota archaeon]|nr:glycosyltransferase family 2 protein [Candidatus Jordarchaeia archaeon]